MFVLTADQIDSRHAEDRAGAMLDRISGAFSADVELPPERTAGDEIQLFTASPHTALSALTLLFRDQNWRIGLGVGDVDTPYGPSTRASRGPAFYAARDAVERAQASPVRTAVVSGTNNRDEEADDVDALLTLLLMLLDRRTRGGWEVYDLLEVGHTQAQAADRLGLTPGAVSLRARAAGIRAQMNAEPALVRLLTRLDDSES